MSLKVGKASWFHKFATSRWTECSMWQEAKRAWLGQTRSRTRMVMRSKMMSMTTMAILRTTWVQMPVDTDIRLSWWRINYITSMMMSTISIFVLEANPFNHQSSGAQLGRCLWDVDRGRPATASQKVKDFQKNRPRRKSGENLFDKENFYHLKMLAYGNSNVRNRAYFDLMRWLFSNTRYHAVMAVPLHLLEDHCSVFWL